MWYSAVGFLVTLTLNLLAAPLAADAQAPAKVPRIGVLSSASPTAPSFPSPFVQGLRDLGYVEGQHITFAYRYAEGNLDRLPDLAAELVRLPVDILVAGGVAAALAAKHATTTIPIVFSGAATPVSRGLVASLAQPGGNITGVSFDLGPGALMKRLELLKEAVPTVSRVAIVMGQVRSPNSEATEKAQDSAVQRLGLTLRRFYVGRPEEFTEWVFPAITADAPVIDALYVDGPVAVEQRQQIADFALQNRLPTVGIVRGQAEAGGLLSYGPNGPEMSRRAATYVDKILQGTKPADLPVEQRMKFELVVNLKAAKALGLTIPPTFLFQADEVIQ